MSLANCEIWLKVSMIGDSLDCTSCIFARIKLRRISSLSRSLSCFSDCSSLVFPIISLPFDAVSAISCKLSFNRSEVLLLSSVMSLLLPVSLSNSLLTFSNSFLRACSCCTSALTASEGCTPNCKSSAMMSLIAFSNADI